jgi:hypothetical protein
VPAALLEVPVLVVARARRGEQDDVPRPRRLPRGGHRGRQIAAAAPADLALQPLRGLPDEVRRVRAAAQRREVLPLGVVAAEDDVDPLAA